MSDPTLFTVGAMNADTTVQSVLVDGCKITFHFSKKSNPTALQEIKSILTASLSAHKDNENL